LTIASSSTMSLTPNSGSVPPPDPSSSSYPVPASGHKVALGVTLAVVGVLLIAATTYFTVRMRRAKPDQDMELSEDEKRVQLPVRTKSTIIDPRPPSSLFDIHEPGTNMRIARRRQDGAWEFEDPEGSFTLEGVDDPSPSPLSPTASVLSQSKVSRYLEAKSERDDKRDTSPSAVSYLEPPPPAYYPDDQSGESSNTK
jgi:hypothetical protein